MNLLTNLSVLPAFKGIAALGYALASSERQLANNTIVFKGLHDDEGDGTYLLHANGKTRFENRLPSYFGTLSRSIVRDLLKPHASLGDWQAALEHVLQAIPKRRKRDARAKEKASRAVVTSAVPPTSPACDGITARVRQLEEDAAWDIKRRVRNYQASAKSDRQMGMPAPGEHEVHVTTNDHHFTYKVVRIFPSGVDVVNENSTGELSYAFLGWYSLMPYSVFTVLEAIDNAGALAKESGAKVS